MVSAYRAQIRVSKRPCTFLAPKGVQGISAQVRLYLPCLQGGRSCCVCASDVYCNVGVADFLGELLRSFNEVATSVIHSK